MQRLRSREEGWNNAWNVGEPNSVGRSIDVGGAENNLQRYSVANRRHVSGHRAVAHRDEYLCAFPNLSDHRQVILIGYRAFHKSHVDVLGELLDVEDWTVDDVGEPSQIQEALVDIQERHVAAGAAAQPRGGDPRLPGLVAT